ncbi:MAG: helix-turn-helix transcriptional regulator, partial [Paludibacteraceae bacterium]|nr:helix-turn-helix transcriptional regulator [Paludibacteraceae bacterium]
STHFMFILLGLIIFYKSVFLNNKFCLMEQKENNIEDKRLIAIGKLIKQLRIEMGYSSAEIFAYEKNINRISYWRMEKGSNITLNSLLKILDIHQISLSEFFNRVEI